MFLRAVRHHVASKSAGSGHVRACTLLSAAARIRSRQLMKVLPHRQQRVDHVKMCRFPIMQHAGIARALSSAGPSVAASTSAALTHHPDGMPRWPSLTSAPGILRASDWIGTVTFSVGGCVLAGQVGMDLLGCTLVGTITAIGGGTFRDAIVLNKQPFWTEEIEYLWICLGTAMATFALWPTIEQEKLLTEDSPIMQWGDALGVGAFAIIGVQNGIRACSHPLVSLCCGVATATFGGMTRDVLCDRPVRILHSHADIYASTAAIGAAAYLAVRSIAPAAIALRIGLGVGASMLMRWAAWTFDLKLPSWTNSITPESVDVESS